MNTVTADRLKAGDVVHYNAQTDWKLLEVVKETSKTVTWSLEYLRCDFSPTRVGDIWTHTFRKATKVAATTADLAVSAEAEALQKNIDAALAIHDFKPTGRYEYSTDASGAVLNVMPTYWCDSCQHIGFKDDPCDTRKALLGDAQ